MKELKKLFYLIPALLMALGFICITALADEVTNEFEPIEITGEQLLGLAEDNVVVLYQDYMLADSVLVDTGSLTVRGEEGGKITLTSASSDPMFQVSGGSMLTLENVILDIKNADTAAIDLDGTHLTPSAEYGSLSLGSVGDEVISGMK